MSNFEAIAFDVDGTLVDSFPVHAQAEVVAAAEMGVNTAEYDWSTFAGLGRQALWEQIAINNSCDWQEFDMYADTMFDHLVLGKKVELSTIPGAKAFLAFVRARGIDLAQVTNSVRSNLDSMNQRLRWMETFKTTIAYLEAGRGKPSPDPYFEACYRLGVTPEKLLVIEDSPTGIQSARCAGAYAVGITTYCDRELLFASGAKMVVDEYRELAWRVSDHMV